MTRTQPHGRPPAPPAGPRPRERRFRGLGWPLLAGLVLLAGLLVVLAVVAVPTARDRPAAEPEPEPEAGLRTVSCAAYGLDHRATSRHREDGDDGGLRTPAAERGDRFDLPFEHDGVTSRYHVLAEGVDWDRPVGVVFRLHGDGAFEFDSPQYNVSCLADVAREHNMILVVPRTPDTEGTPTWWEAKDRNAEWLSALLEERLLADYDLDRSRTWWTGYSGGAQLITQELLADHMELFPGGGAIMLGGGGVPEEASSEPTRAQLRNLRLHWDVGREDDGTDPRADDFNALVAALRGHEFYEETGFDRATLNVREGYDHFDLPDAGILDRVLTQAQTRAGDG